MSRHAALMDAAGFWRQFVTAFYFDKPGDEVAGALLWYGPAAPKPDDPPQIRLQTKDGRVVEVTASQERLKAELVRLEPAVGDRLRIRYDGEAERAAPGMSRSKLFTVEVRRKGSQPEAGAGPVRGSDGPENGPRAGGKD